MNHYNLIKRCFNQYLVVLKCVNKTKRELTLLDVGAQDCKLKEILPQNINYSSLDMSGSCDYNINLNNQKIPVKDRNFDILVCLETLEHVFYPEKVIQELKRVTKDDGLFILSMPNEYNFWLRLNHLFAIRKKDTDEPFKVIEKLQHIHKPRFKDIVDLFSKHFEIIDIVPIWQSRMSTKNKFYYFIDKILNILAKRFPSLFARIVVVIARKNKSFQ